MCKSIQRTGKAEVIVGYKFVIKDSKGRFVSPITGVIYTPGKIPKPALSERKRAIAHCDKTDILSKWLFPKPGTRNYNADMEGLTGLFRNLREVYAAKRYYSQYVVIEIKGLKVATGIYNRYFDINLIDEIYSIKEVEPV